MRIAGVSAREAVDAAWSDLVEDLDDDLDDVEQEPDEEVDA